CSVAQARTASKMAASDVFAGSMGVFIVSVRTCEREVKKVSADFLSQRRSFKTCITTAMAGRVGAEKSSLLLRTALAHRLWPAANTPAPAPLRCGAGSGPSRTNGARGGRQHSRTNNALAVSATNPNIE